MERSDHFSRDFEKKPNKKKAKPKKRWLLSRQYLQPLEEPEDEPDPDNLCDSKLKHKLKSICRSAFYGMKEGLLTGVFIGGCYGIFTYLNTSSLFDSSGGGESQSGRNSTARNQGGGVHPTRKSNPSKNRRKPAESRAYVGVTRRQIGSRSNSITYHEKLSNYRTLEEKIYGYTRETNPSSYSESPFSGTKLNYSKLPIKSNKYWKMIQDDKKKYNFEKFNDNVAIVGYAFVKTTGAFETGSENISPKQSKTDTEKKESGEETEEGEEENEEQDKLANSFGARFSPKGSQRSSKVHEKVTSKEEAASKQNPDLKEEFSEKEESLPMERPSKLLSPRKNGTSQGSVGSNKYRDKWKRLKSDISTVEKTDDDATEEPSAKAKPESSVISVKGQKSGKIKSSSINGADDSNASNNASNVGEKQNRDSKTKAMQKMFSSIKSSRSRSKQSVISQSIEDQKAKPSRITIISPKQYATEAQEKNAEQSSSVLIKSLEPDQSEISTRATVDMSQDSRVRSDIPSSAQMVSNKTSKPLSKNSVKEIPIIIETEASDGNISKKSSKEAVKSKHHSLTKSNASQTRSSVFSENVYPTKNAPSYLVNAEDVSNHFESPRQKVSHQPSEHEKVYPKYSESIFSAEFDVKADYDDVGYTGSNISEFQLEHGGHRAPPKETTTSQPPEKVQDSTAHHGGSTHVVQYSETDLAHLSNHSLKTPKQSRPVVFSGSLKETSQNLLDGVLTEKMSQAILDSDLIRDIKKSPQSDHSLKSGTPGEHFEKSAIPREDFLKSVNASEQSLKRFSSKEQHPKAGVTSQQSSKSGAPSEVLAKLGVLSENLPKSIVTGDTPRKPSQLSEPLPRSRVASDNSQKAKVSSDYGTRPVSEHLPKSGVPSENFPKSRASGEHSSRPSSEPFSKTTVPSENLSKSRVSGEYGTRSSVPSEYLPKSKVSSNYSAKGGVAVERVTKSRVPSENSAKTHSLREHISKSEAPSDYSAKLGPSSQFSAKSGVPSYHSTRSEVRSEHLSKQRVPSEHSAKLGFPSHYSGKSGVPSYHSAKSEAPSEHSTKWEIVSERSGKSAVLSDYSTKWSGANADASAKSGLPTAISANWSIRSGTSAKSAVVSDYSLKSTAISEHSEKSTGPLTDLLSESQERFKSPTQEPTEKSYASALDESPERRGIDPVGKAKTEKSYSQEASGFKLLSTVTDNTMVFCACNCALVLGIICTVVSTTRASLLKI